MGPLEEGFGVWMMQAEDRAGKSCCPETVAKPLLPRRAWRVGRALAGLKQELNTYLTGGYSQGRPE